MPGRALRGMETGGDGRLKPRLGVVEWSLQAVDRLKP